MSRSQKRHRKVRGISLRPVEDQALGWLAHRLTRGNLSALVASLIVKAAREEIGRDWEVVVTGTATTPEREAA